MIFNIWMFMHPCTPLSARARICIMHKVEPIKHEMSMWSWEWRWPWGALQWIMLPIGTHGPLWWTPNYSSESCTDTTKLKAVTSEPKHFREQPKLIRKSTVRSIEQGTKFRRIFSATSKYRRSKFEPDVTKMVSLNITQVWHFKWNSA